MRRLLAVSLIAACSLNSAPVFADCATIEDAKLDADCVVMPYGEQRGVWFRLDRAEELRKAHLELPELRLQISNYEQLAGQRDAQVLLLREAAGEYKSALGELKQVNEVLVTDAREAREERDRARNEIKKWYRSPFLWFGAGVVVTLATGVTVALSVR